MTGIHENMPENETKRGRERVLAIVHARMRFKHKRITHGRIISMLEWRFSNSRISECRPEKKGLMPRLRHSK